MHQLKGWEENLVTTKSYSIRNNYSNQMFDLIITVLNEMKEFYIV